MASPAKTFRVFVSSTFSDLTAERNALHERVYPRLRELCMKHNARFQAVDLRWGVSEEASLDQQTMNICLSEIARCQQITPRPNFLVLLGDRYGWCPPPPQIPALEFDALLERISTEDRDLLLEWYHCDENAVPSEYCLQPREQGSIYEDYSSWQPVEARLQRILAEASGGLNLPEARRLAYKASATHQEIAAGAIQVEDADKHVFCFFRQIEGLPQDHRAAAYIDLDENGRLDQGAQTSLQGLKEQLKERLPENIIECDAVWTGDGVSIKDIDAFCEEVFNRLAYVILEETLQADEKDSLAREVEDHLAFGEDRARIFVGREEILQTIDDYLQQGTRNPLGLWGASGSGKSAVMARAIQRAHSNFPNAEIIVRFIGATPISTDRRELLKSLCLEIYRRYAREYWEGGSEVPDNYRDLIEEFSVRLRLAMASAERPMFIFIDALDQLSETDDLDWLPEDLADHVRLIVSTTPGACQSILAAKLPEVNLIQLPLMPPEQGSRLLDFWLGDAHRTLQPHQREEVLGKFAGCGLPLYLKLAFEESRRWKSYTNSADTQLHPDVPGVIHDLLTRLSTRGGHGALMVSRSLSYLAAAKYGLTEDELLEVLSGDAELYAWFLSSIYHIPPDLMGIVLSQLERDGLTSDKRTAQDWLDELREDEGRLQAFLTNVLDGPGRVHLPVVLWSRLYADLEPYLTQRTGDGTVLLAFYHRQLEEVIMQEYLFGANRLARHAGLACYFQSLPYHIQSNGGRAPNLRKFSEQLYHQVCAELWDQAEATLTDLDYMQAKLEGMATHELTTDFDTILAAGKYSHSLQLVRNALSAAAHILDEDVSQLPAQLTGRLLSADLPAIERLLLQVRKWDRPWIRTLLPNLTPAGGPLLRTLSGHKGAVLSVTITPDGKRAVSGAYDKALKVWDLQTGEQLATMMGHIGEVNRIVVTPDGRRAVSSCYNGMLMTWDLETGMHLSAYDEHSQMGKRIVGVGVTPDGLRVISACTAGHLRVWDLKTGAEQVCLEEPSGELNGFALTPDGCRAITSSKNGMLRVWDLEKGAELAAWQAQVSDFIEIVVTPDGQRAITGSDDGVLKIWDLEKGHENTLEGHTDSIRCIAVTPDGRRLVSGSEDKTLKVWDSESGTELFTLIGHTEPVGSLALTPDGSWAVSASGQGKILKLWDLEGGAELGTLEGHTSYINDLALSPDGNQVISASSDGSLKLWNVDLGFEQALPCQHTDAVHGVAVARDGSRAISGAFDGVLKVWDLKSFTESAMLHGHTHGILDLDISADGRRAVTASVDRTVKVWDLERGKELFTLSGHDGIVRGVAITPDGRRAISAGDDRALVLWDLENGEELHGFFAYKDIAHVSVGVWDVAVSANARYAVSCSNAYMGIVVWDLETEERVASYVGHEDAVHCVAMTPTCRYAVSGFRDGTLKVWNLAEGVEHATLTGHSGGIVGVAIDADERLVVSASGDKSLRVWDVRTGEQIACLTGESMFISCAIGGTKIVAGDNSGRVHFLQLEGFETEG